MTSVSGHLTSLDVAPTHKGWTDPPPQELFFKARVVESVSEVMWSPLLRGFSTDAFP